MLEIGCYAGINPINPMSTSAVKGHISVDKISVVYDVENPVVAVKDLSFNVEAGEFVSIVGPSGCGKSTILNTIAGFITPTSGAAFIDGAKITSPGADRGVVFQNYELFPWKTVFQNIEFGLKMSGKMKEVRTQLVKEYIDKIGLADFADRFPSELSCGMAQRVGLARVLINEPTVILLDEPFASLDSQIRLEMQELLMEMLEASHKTMINVTHDYEEAIRLSDRIIVMTALPGRIKKIMSSPFPRPREYSITGSQEFIEMKLLLYSLIKDELQEQAEI